MIKIKRIYNEKAEEDGYRVLIDRLWPRGMSKDRAAIDLWFKEIAPSSQLRTWFGHKPEHFNEFREKYTNELSTNPAVKMLENIASKYPVITLLYAAKDPAINHAVVLQEYLKKIKPNSKTVK